MRCQRQGEDRVEYLVRVLHEYMDVNAVETVHYDGVECDGMCLADDFCNALNIDPEDDEENFSWKKELEKLIDG